MSSLSISGGQLQFRPSRPPNDNRAKEPLGLFWSNIKVSLPTLVLLLSESFAHPLIYSADWSDPKGKIRVQATMGPNPIQTPYPNKGQHLASHRSSPSQLDSVKIDSCSHARALAQETLMALCKSSDMLWPWPILSIAEAEHEEADSAGIVDEYARGGHVPSLGEFIATKHPRYHHAFNVFRALRSVPNPSVGTLSQCSLTVYMVGKENPMATKSKLRKCCRAMCYMR